MRGAFMEEQAQKECQVKKCCAKGIIILIVCSLVCFFLGYYAGSKSLAKVSGSAINRPFNPRNIPRTPPKAPSIPKIPNIQNRNIPQRVPNIQRPPVPNTPGVNTPGKGTNKTATHTASQTKSKK